MIDQNLSVTVGTNGILTALIDMPGRSMNVFSSDMMDSLEKLIEHVEGTPSIRSVVLSSGKSAFLAGADLDMIRMFSERGQTDTPEQLHDLCGRLGRLFRQIEKSKKPWIAAVNGLALGGGLELALACHERVVSNEASIQLGLPEIKLGLLPGAGGTQRLPRLIGAEEALRMLLLGTSVTSQQALSLGLVHEIASPGNLLIAAQRRAESCVHPVASWDVPGKTFSSSPYDFADPNVFATITSALNIDQQTLHKYPAYNAILNCVVKAWNKPMDEAIVWEMDCFVDLIRDPVAGNMVRTLFLNRQKASKLGLLAPNSPLAEGSDALLPRIRAAYHDAEAVGCSEDETLLAVAFAAIRSWAEGKVPAPELADVAVVTAGLYPSYTGGPFNYTRQHGLDALLRRANAASSKRPMLFAWPANIENFIDSKSVAANQ